MSVEQGKRDLLIVDLHGARLGEESSTLLDGMTERHIVQPFDLGMTMPLGDIERVLRERRDSAIAFVLHAGVPSPALMRRIKHLLRERRKVYFYWPAEHAVEIADDLRLASYRNLYWFVRMTSAAMRARGAWRRLRSDGIGTVFRLAKNELEQAHEVANIEQQLTVDLTRGLSARLRAPHGSAQTVARRFVERFGVSADHLPSPAQPIAGNGIYFRFDYWARIMTGGSYGHTCYVAQSLNRVTRDFEAVMTNRFDLLDELGVRQQVLDVDYRHASSSDLIVAGKRFEDQVMRLLDERAPAYVYERLVLGNRAVGRACATSGVPYILEYNGSEISMARAFGTPHDREDLLERLEDFSFGAASVISVVSNPIADALVARGFDRNKILVNPNCVNPEVYRPYAADEKQAVRDELGVAPGTKLVGFCGTFGGWHGINVLAAALPAICAGDPAIRMLLIGDGNEKHLVREAVAAHDLDARVIDVGLVPQMTGARYLSACDILVSPHAQNIDGQVFFGSPTKLFEYMATGAAVIASDLAQIGEVLRPALRLADFANGAPAIGNERGVHVTPGDVDEFVAAVLAVARYPETWPVLGGNARDAVMRNYTWDIHVENLWRFMAGLPLVGYVADANDIGATNTGG